MNCPTCGCEVEVGGKGTTHYYVPKGGVMQSKPIRAWAVKTDDDPILLWSIDATRAGVIGVVERATGGFWKTMRKKLGYRVRRITITVEEK